MLQDEQMEGLSGPCPQGQEKQVMASLQLHKVVTQDNGERLLGCDLPREATTDTKTHSNM